MTRGQSIYVFYPDDQRSNNWLLFEEHGESGAVKVKPEHQHLFCPKCSKYDPEAAFGGPITLQTKIRAKGDTCLTSDGFLLISEKLNALLESKRIEGLERRPLADSGWHLARAPHRVPADDSRLERGTPVCRKCKLPRYFGGGFHFRSQLGSVCPNSMFFTTNLETCSVNALARRLFATEDIVLTLKEAGMKGGEFHRLLNAEEEAQVLATGAQGKAKWPKNHFIVL